MNPSIIYHKGIACLDDDSHFTKWIKESGKLDHDTWLLPKVLKYCKKGSTVVDAGAMYGDHTIAYSRAVGPEGLVLAFEPNPMAYKCLEHNCGKLNNVHTIPFGLSDKKESFGLLIESENYGMANLRGEGDIQCVPLDQYLESIKNLSFAKVDVEGFEPKFLAGAVQTIRKHRPVMLIEMNIATLQRNGFTYDDIFNFLDTMGYTSRNVNESGGFDEPQYDLLCLPG